VDCITKPDLLLFNQIGMHLKEILRENAIMYIVLMFLDFLNLIVVLGRELAAQRNFGPTKEMSRVVSR